MSSKRRREIDRAERERIAAKLRQGISLLEIQKAHGIQRPRVHEIAAEFGIEIKAQRRNWRSWYVD